MPTLVLWDQGPERGPNEWAGVDIEVDSGAFLPSWPTYPEPDWEAPDVIDTTRPRRVQWAVSSIRDFDWKGELLQARIEGMRPITFEGNGSIRLSCPTSDVSLLDTLCTDVETWDTTTGVLKIIDRAVHPVIDGQVAPGYVLRSEAEVKDGIVTLTAQEPQRLFADRIVGQGIRKDLLNGRGHFPGIGPMISLGITWTGAPADVEWVPNGGVRGGRALRIRGEKPNDYLEIRCTFTQPEGTTNQQVTVRSSAFFNVPDDPEILEGTDMIKTEVWQGTTRFSPPPGEPNAFVASVDDSTPRGEYGRNPVTSAALLPVPPYTVTIVTYLYPQSETEWTTVSDIEVFRRDTLSTGVPRDLVEQQAILIREMQSTARGKSSWSLVPEIGALCGVEEVGVWRAEDEEPLPDALAKIDQRDDGPDPPYVTAAWRVRCQARRGAVRPDLLVGPTEILSSDGWTHDPGQQVSEARGLTDAGSDYWRVSHVERDTTHTDGHVIERQVRLPNDLPLLALAEATKAKLATLSQPQETTRILVKGDLGRRVAVGDTGRVVQRDGVLRQDERMRVVQWAIDDEADIVALDLGADQEDL